MIDVMINNTDLMTRFRSKLSQLEPLPPQIPELLEHPGPQSLTNHPLTLKMQPERIPQHKSVEILAQKLRRRSVTHVWGQSPGGAER